MVNCVLRLARLGSFKGLQVNSWITLKKGPALWFCTQTDEPKKPVKKTKAVGKTEAPHKRAALLAHRTAVSFPVRLLEPGGFPLGGTEDSITAAPVGEAAQVVEPLAEVECESSAPEESLGLAGATEKATIASSEPQDTAADDSSSSSSSSSSDTDSDSDSDSDEKLDREAKIRNVPPECADATPVETKGAIEAAGGVQHPGRGPRGCSEESYKLRPETGSGTPADVIEDAAASLITEAQNKTPSLQVAQAEAPAELPAEPAEVSKESQRVAAPRPVTSTSLPPEAAAEEPAEVSKESQRVAAPRPVTSTSLPPEATAEEPAEVSKESQRVAAPRPVTSTSLPPEAAAEAETLSTAEDPKDPVLVSAEATGEDLSLETAAEQLEELAAAAAAEPEEPFDNSTYKNCQHHSYTSFTFVDLDVDMAKYRLPQPSSGRPSPRH